MRWTGPARTAGRALRGCTAGLGALLVAAVLAAPASAAPGTITAYSMDQGAGTTLPDIRYPATTARPPTPRARRRAGSEAR